MPVTPIPPAAPVIVLGAPLSGTDRVAAALHGAGLVLGHDRNRFGESHFVLDQNRWLFRCAHAEWDVTEPLLWSFEDEILCEGLADALRQRCEGKGIKGFLGWKTHLRTRSLLAYQEPWGWADTLTCFTLPLWLRVFPKARVVHVVRNGVDVALDLAAREATRRAELKSRARSARCLDPDRAFDVWGAYVGSAVAAAERMPADRVLRLRCEELSERPEAALARIWAFAAAQPEQDVRAALLGELDPLPIDAFQASETGQALYRRRAGHPLMKRLGYDGLKAAS